MDFDQIETFLEVARLASFSRAAEKRFRTQPAISSQIRGLEEEVGARLHARDVASDIVRIEELLDKGRVGRIILQQENSQRTRHDAFLHADRGGGSLITAQNMPSSLTALMNSWKSTGFTT